MSGNLHIILDLGTNIVHLKIAMTIASHHGFDMFQGVSGRLDDNYLVHKLEQGCLANLENCHIKEEVISSSSS